MIQEEIRTKKYWWVNQNRSHKQEISGGYMWSPKLKRDGKQSPFYNFMCDVRPGDILYSYYGKKIRSIGIIQSQSYSYEKPSEIQSDWNRDGWKVNVEYSSLENPIDIKDHIEHLRNFLPEKYHPFREDGRGLERYLTIVPFELSNEINKIILSEFEIILKRSNRIGIIKETEKELIENEEIKKIQINNNINKTEKESLIKSRVGQGKFRKDVISLHKECFFTKIKNPKLLRSSHLKPWSKCNNNERLNPYNGLPLTPSYDLLLDQGYISFDKDGKLLISDLLSDHEKETLLLNQVNKTLTINSHNLEFINYHREKIFKS